MAVLDFKVIIEPRLLAVCRLQAEIINDLHDQIYDNPAIDAKVSELQKMFEAANLDEPLRKIQYEAFAAGFIEGSVHGKSVKCAQSLDHTVCDKFEEWVNNND